MNFVELIRDRKKVTHIQKHSQVAINFNSTFTGGDFVVLIGDAELLSDPVSPGEMQTYLKKYEKGLVDINMTDDEFQDSYNTAIRIKPDQLHGY